MNSNDAVFFDCIITNKNTTMDTKALRQKILDLAIHGKLVPQDPNDEPASVLLERIKAEKERLIKEVKSLQRLLIRPIMRTCYRKDGVCPLWVRCLHFKQEKT